IRHQHHHFLLRAVDDGGWDLLSWPLDAGLLVLDCVGDLGRVAARFHFEMNTSFERGEGQYTDKRKQRGAEAGQGVHGRSQRGRFAGSSGCAVASYPSLACTAAWPFLALSKPSWRNWRVRSTSPRRMTTSVTPWIPREPLMRAFAPCQRVKRDASSSPGARLRWNRRIGPNRLRTGVTR